MHGVAACDVRRIVGGWRRHPDRGARAARQGHEYEPRPHRASPWHHRAGGASGSACRSRSASSARTSRPTSARCWCVCHVKGIRYEIDPIVPFMGDDRFSALSPLRRIPVLTDDQVTLADFVGDLPVPRGSLTPRRRCSPARRRRPRPGALARGVRRHPHGRGVHPGTYFNQLVIRRFVWGEEDRPGGPPEGDHRGDPVGARLPGVTGPAGRLPVRRPVGRRRGAGGLLPERRLRALQHRRPRAWPGTAAYVARVLDTEGSSGCSGRSRTASPAPRSRSIAPSWPRWVRPSPGSPSAAMRPPGAASCRSEPGSPGRRGESRTRRAAALASRRREGHSGYWPAPLLAASASAIFFAISALTASRLKLAPRCIGGKSRKL